MNIQKEMNGNDEAKTNTNYDNVDNKNQPKRDMMSANLQNTNSKMAPGPDKLPPDFQMKFIAVMDSLAVPSAPALVKAFDLSPHTEAVDLGGWYYYIDDLLIQNDYSRFLSMHRLE